MDSATGIVNWTYQVGGPIYGTPAIGPDGTIYVCGADGNLYAFTDLGTSAQLKWTFAATSGLTSSPAVATDGTIYFSSNGGFLYSLTDFGDYAIENWASQADGPFYTSPAIGADGTIYIGSDDDSLYAFNGQTGVLDWSQATGSFISSDAVIGPGGTVYVCSFDGFVYSFDGSTGTPGWTFNAGGPSTTPVLGSNGVLYVATVSGSDNILYALDASTGAMNWDADNPNGSGYPTLTLASDGTIYFNSDDLYSLTDTGSTWAGNWDDPVASETDFAVGGDGTIYAPDGISGMYAINNSEINAVRLSTYSVVGSTPVNGKIYLSGDALFNLYGVTLQSNNACVTTPSALIVQQDGTVSFQLQTTTVANTQTVTLTATCQASTKQVTLTVTPALSLSSIQLKPSSVTGGNNTTGQVFLNAPAPGGGVVVPLSSTNLSAPVPVSITVPAGSSSATFTISTANVSFGQSSMITAGPVGGAFVAANLFLNGAQVQHIKLMPNMVQGGAQINGVIFLTGPAPSGGQQVNITTSNTDSDAPTSVTVPSGATAANFFFTPVSVSATEVMTVTATTGKQSSYATLTLYPADILQVKLLQPTVQGGANAQCVTFLGGKAGPSGDVVSLSSNSGDATVPATVNIAAGSNATNFTISTNPVAALETITITAASPDGVRSQATLTLTPPTLSEIKSLPTAVKGGTPNSAAVFLTGKAGPGGVSVGISSSSTDVTLPASVTIAAGASATNFVFSTKQVSSTEVVTLIAAVGSTIKQTTLTLNPPSLWMLRLLPTATVQGGKPIDFVVFLTGKAGPQGAVVTLSSGSSSVVVPGSVTLQAGTTATNLYIQTKAVTTQTQVTLTATLGASTSQIEVTLTP